MQTLQMIAFAFTMAGAGGVLLLSLILGISGRRPKAGEVVPDREAMRAHTLGRIFYVNPADPRGFVPRPWGGGLTVNFRRKAYVAILLAFLAETVAGAIALVLLRP